MNTHITHITNDNNIHFTKHVLERIKERNISKEDVLKTIKHGIKINDSEIRDSNIIVIYTISKSKTTIITTYTSKDIKLNDEEEKLWLTLYNLMNSRLETSYEETLNKFKHIEQEFNQLKTHNVTFEQFLTFDDAIVVTNNNSKVIENFPPVSLLTGSIKKGKNNILDILLSEYNLKLDIPYNSNPYSPIHQTFKKLELIIEDELIISLNWLMDKFEKEDNLEYFKTLLLKKEYGYTLLHRALYNGFDKLSCWLINNGACITSEQENKTKYNETIYDLINKKKSKLKQTDYLLKKKNTKVDIPKKDITKKNVFKGNMFYLLEED